MDNATEVFLRQKFLIENQLDNLQQAVTFLYQDYTFHHKNNELKILEYHVDRLNEAKQKLNTVFEAQQELRLKIDEAKLKTAEADELLRKIEALERKSKTKRSMENRKI